MIFHQRHRGLGFLGRYVGRFPLWAPDRIGFEGTGFALHVKLVANDNWCAGQQSFANTDSRHRATINIAEQVHVSLEITDCDSIVERNGRRRFTSQQRILTPDLIAIAPQQRDELSLAIE
jgi:hypothetical protein